MKSIERRKKKISWVPEMRLKNQKGIIAAQSL